MTISDLGCPAWIVESMDFPVFLDMTFQSNFGEIWLYNNDLQMLIKDKAFRELYLSRIANILSKNIDAVKILVSKEHEHKIFPTRKTRRHSELIRNLRQIAKLPDGKKRLMTFYFGKISDAKIPKILKEISNSNIDTWVFYTIRNTLDPTPGIVMVRHNVFPFHVRGEREMFAIVWQLREQKHIQKLLKEAFESVFNSKKNFSYIDVKSINPFRFRLTKGWSELTAKKLEERKKELSDGLAFGDSVDVAVLSSQREELAPLEKLLGCVEDTPLKFDSYRYALIHRGTHVKKVLLAVIGQGNIAAATRTWDVIDKWRPKQVILVGVAGGDPSDPTLKLGDIVIGESIIGYEHGKIDASGFKQRSTRYDMSHELINEAERLAENWPKEKLDGYLSKSYVPPSVHRFAIASGSKLVADHKFFKNVREMTNEKIHAIEMEGDGVGFACHNHASKPELLVVKSIMDKSDKKTRDINKKNRERWKKYACRVASQFVYDLLTLS